MGKAECLEKNSGKLVDAINEASKYACDRESFMDSLLTVVSSKPELKNNFETVGYYGKDAAGNPTENLIGYGFKVTGEEFKINSSELDRKLTFTNLEKNWGASKESVQAKVSSSENHEGLKEEEEEGVAIKRDFLDNKKGYTKKGANLDEIRSGLEQSDAGKMVDELGKSIAEFIGAVVSLKVKNQKYDNFYRGVNKGVEMVDDRPVLLLEQKNKTGESLIRQLPLSTVSDLEVLQAGQKFALHEMRFNGGEFRGIPEKELKPYLPALLCGKQPFIGLSSETNKPMLTEYIEKNGEKIKIHVEGRLQLRRSEKGNMETWVRVKFQKFEFPKNFAGVELTDDMKNQLMANKASQVKGLVVSLKFQTPDGGTVENPQRIWFDEKCNRLVASPLLKEQREQLMLGENPKTIDVEHKVVENAATSPLLKEQQGQLTLGENPKIIDVEHKAVENVVFMKKEKVTGMKVQH